MMKKTDDIDYSDFLRLMLEKFPLVNEIQQLSFDEIKNHPVLSETQDYINSVTESSIDKIVSESFAGKNIFESKRFETEVAKTLLFTYNLCEIINNVLAKLYNPYPENQDIYFKLMVSGLHQFRGIVSLYLSGCEFSILALFRTLYENMLVFKFLAKHKDLIPAYNDHANIEYLKLDKEFKDEAEIAKIDQEIKAITDKYKNIKNFESPYGWARSVYSDIHNLTPIYTELGYESYSPIYFLACDFIHSSALAVNASNQSDTDLVFIKPFLDSAMKFLFEHTLTLLDNISIPKSTFFILVRLVANYYSKLD